LKDIITILSIEMQYYIATIEIMLTHRERMACWLAGMA